MTSTLAVHYSTGKDDWATPPDLFAALDAEFGFTLDVAANSSNTKCGLWLGPDSVLADDALDYYWPRLHTCWCNPPYSRGLQAKFIAKAAEEQQWRGVTTVMLLPARTDTKAFHQYVWDVAKHQPREGVEVRFLKGRLKFVGAKHGAPFPSMVVVFRGKA